MSKKVSIIIPNCCPNDQVRGLYLSCLASLYSQTPQALCDVTIVNNGGVQKKYGGPYAIPTVELWYGEPLGFARAVNEGLKHATGEYVCVLSNDVTVSAGWLEALLSEFEACPNMGVLAPMDDDHKAGCMCRWCIVRQDWAAGKPGYPALYKDWHWGACYLVKREGFYLEEALNWRYCDQDLSIRMKKAGLEVARTSRAVVHHVGEATWKALPESSTDIGYCERLEMLGRHGAAMFDEWARQNEKPAVDVPTFSILHSSVRPHQWRKIYDAWLKAADDFGSVEYVLVAGGQWGFDRDALQRWAHSRPGLNKLIWSPEQYSYVYGVNCAAQISTGTVLIVNADDQYPCEQWDTHLRGRMGVARAWKKEAVVLEVSTGTPKEHERGIMVMPILSRARYEQQGYVFFPEFESMYADNDFCEQARHDNVILDARHLFFPHRHPTIEPSVPIDDAYQQQNRPEAYKIGKEVIEKRRAQRNAKPAGPPTIALCLSGENFHGSWVDGLLNLYDHLIHTGFNIYRLRAYQSNVYVTREEIRLAMKTIEPHPDFLLWLDDDNILTPENFDLLVSALNESECDGITGWCWIHDEENKRFRISCGTIAPDGLHWNSFTPGEFQEHKEPFEVPGLASGFPCFLMKWSAIEKAGERPFLPFLDNSLPCGMNGEDIAYSIRAMKGGARFLVDPRVQVPHLKYTDTIPAFPEAETKEPVIAVMMRVKNEGRWIDRCVRAALELTPRVYVMDDGSTDDTVGLCLKAGACVLTSPYLSGELDEARDKNWLLDLIVADLHPDWILCIDGDEELEPNGVQKIKGALRHAKHDTYAMKFLYLWDKPDRARLDRWYSTFHRLSLFRPNPDLRFHSLYEGKGVHSGLHTGNAPVGAPGQVQITPGLLNVYLLHYGYMYKEDRIRKYEYYNRLDPNNEMEDRYRHIVQGDIPEVPWDKVLKYAGPLDVRTLPESFLRRPLLEIEVKELSETSAAD